MTTTMSDIAASVATNEPATRGRASSRTRRRFRFSPWHLLLAPLSLLFAFPFVQMIMVSFMPREDINRLPPRFVPTSVTLDGYRGLFERSDVLIWLMNSTIVATVAVASNVVLCSLAGYGFARLRFRGRELAHPELGMKLLQKVRADFDPIAKCEYEPRMEGRQMIMILAPR